MLTEKLLANKNKKHSGQARGPAPTLFCRFFPAKKPPRSTALQWEKFPHPNPLHLKWWRGGKKNSFDESCI